MRFAFIADIHLSYYSNDSIVHETGLPDRLHHLQKILFQIVNYCKENKIDKIVIGGDIYHTKSLIHSVAQSILIDFIRLNSDIFFYILDGNHDMSSKSGSGVSGLKSIDKEPNVKTFHEKQKIENILFVPWYNKMVEDIKTNSEDYLITHLGLNEAQLSSGISIISDVSIKDLINRYKTVLLGHYHKPQEIITDQIRVYYVGSILQLDWGEKNEEKRFLVIDTNNDEIKSIPIEGYRKHIVLELTNLNKDQILKRASEFKEQGHHIRIEKVDKDVDMKDIPKNFIVIDKTDRDITNRDIDRSMSEDERLNKILEIREIPVEQRGDYVKSALEIISSSSEEK